MKKSILFLSVFFISFSSVHSQIETDWLTILREVYSGYGLGGPFMFSQQLTVDKDNFVYNCGFEGASNYDLVIGSGSLQAEGNRYDDYFLSQVDEQGNPMWLKQFSGYPTNGYFSHYQMPRIVPHQDGGIIMVSQVKGAVTFGEDTITTVGNNLKLFIGHVATSGEIVSHHILSASNLNLISSLKITANGDLLIAGRLNYGFCRIGEQTITSESDESHFVGRIQQDGLVKWLTNIEPVPGMDAVAEVNVMELVDGNIVATLSAGGFKFNTIGCPDNPRYLALANLNGQNGVVNSVNILAEVDFGYISDITQLENGDLYFVGGFGGTLRAQNGQTCSTAHLPDCNNLNGFLIKANTSGTVYDITTSPDGFVAQKIVLLGDEKYIMAGQIISRQYVESALTETNPGVVIKTYDYQNRLIQAHNITDRANEKAKYDIALVDDNSLIITGQLFYANFLGEDLFDFPHFEKHIFLAKLNLDLQANPTPNTLAPKITLFPNPTNSILNISLGHDFFNDQSIKIYDSAGRVVYNGATIGERTQYPIDIAHLPAGSYTLHIGETQSAGHQFVKH